MGGCPLNSHCEYGFCECRSGYVKGNGQCYAKGLNKPARLYHDASEPCTDTACCQSQDINMVFNNESLAENPCECRQSMKWNTKQLECQFYMDVDCSSITYDNVPSTIVLAAANETMKIIGNETIPLKENITITPNDALKNSLLSNIDPKVASEQELTEAFCRDVDSFSWEFGGLEKPKKIKEGMFSKIETIHWVFVIAGIALICAVLVKCGAKMSVGLKSSCASDDNRNKDENELNGTTNNATASSPLVGCSTAPPGPGQSTDPQATSLSAHTNYLPNSGPAGNQQLPYQHSSLGPSAPRTPYPSATDETPFPSATSVTPYPPATNEPPYPLTSSVTPYPPAANETPYPPSTSITPNPLYDNAASFQPPANSAPYPPPTSGQSSLPTVSHGLPYPVSPFQSVSREEPYIAPPPYNPSM